MPFVHLSRIWFRLIVRRPGTWVFLFLSAVLGWLLYETQPVLSVIPVRSLLPSLVLIFWALGWMHARSFAPRTVLALSEIPGFFSARLKLTLLQLFAFLPFWIALAASFPNPWLPILLSFFLYLPFTELPLSWTGILFAAAVLAFVAPVGLLPLTLGLLFLLWDRLIPSKRVILLRTNSLAVTWVNPLFLWPVGIIWALVWWAARFPGVEFSFRGLLEGSLSVRSPEGAGCVGQYEFGVFLAGLALFSVTLILPLFLSVSAVGCRYLERPLWPSFWLGRAYRRTIPAAFALTFAYTLLWTALTYGWLSYLGVFQDRVLSFSVHLTALALFVAALRPFSPDDPQDLGTFVFGVFSTHLLAVLLLFRLLPSVGGSVSPSTFAAVLLLFALFVPWIWYRLKRAGITL
ncbi:hypothetical protein [Brockia lithotrophica]|uniref:Uncharacterized protein n=1 Tax=Brockia lithotrophica TaxID=933949 RepID=A0A660L9P8_9BACL|nr:hypothetical protein [Brockia lithotrophica]RKQ88663.1 hypothetical protein C7438_0303 [Brockia lithotrophica]